MAHPNLTICADLVIQFLQEVIRQKSNKNHSKIEIRENQLMEPLIEKEHNRPLILFDTLLRYSR